VRYTHLPLRPHPDSFVGEDSNGIVVATVHCWDDLQKWSFERSKLTSDETRRIASAIAWDGINAMRRLRRDGRENPQGWPVVCLSVRPAA
jgi:hypothetical protein